MTIEFNGQEANLKIPSTAIGTNLFGLDIKMVGLIQKVNPLSGWGGDFTIKVKTKGYQGEAKAVDSYPVASVSFAEPVMHGPNL